MGRAWMCVAVAAGLSGLVSCGGSNGDEGAATGTTSLDAAPQCVPVGDGQGVPVKVTLDEWSVMVRPASVAAGPVAFTVDNAGEEPHEMVIVRGTVGDLEIVDGRVDENALADGAFVGEVEPFPAGGSCRGSFELAAGSYVLFCNIVEVENGRRESHVESGMVTTLTVT